MAKATKETCGETVNQDRPETRGYWYLLVTCKSAFYHLYQYLYKQKNICFSIFHQRRNEESLWSDDLPEEVLGLIKLHLFGQDYCSFCAVCRTWRSKGNPFPLHITPSSLIEIPAGLSDSRICSSGDSWLLMWQYSRQVFFLNPFNKTMIELPDFPRQEWDLLPGMKKWSYHMPAFSFSSAPTSSNCIVFGIARSLWAEEVSICIIRHGEARWTIHKCIANNLPFMLSNANPVFHNGLVYCLGEDGNLGVFDPHKDDDRREECNWTVLDHPHTPPFVLTIADGNRFLVQCNGNLFSVFQGHMGKGVSVFSLDHQTMTWNQVQDLEDHMLFLASQTSLSVGMVKAFDRMGDKIYFPIFPISSCDSNRGGMINSCSCVFYSLSTEMYHTFGTSHSSLDICGMKIRRNCAWIEPNFVIPSSKDLKWGLKSSTN
ncbi:F-box/kelch-repeat protein At1g57790-like isoform X2 [Macadamia integrifolia]|uniref:F-box/kelch-repeat protein At1g57790-like isoform X2 n=1 Tax=Macadamia integrifolia TaxID=60698 RepID=UPI001C4E8C8A|nr:F-box/kelch-repeat protein At1g57790-like isoform X2 [Macadamia integrifolia]